MYVKFDGQLKRIKNFEVKVSSTTIYIHTEDEEANLEVYKCPQTSVNYKHIRRRIATDILSQETWSVGTTNSIFESINLNYQSCSHTQTHHSTELISTAIGLQLIWERVKSLISFGYPTGALHKLELTQLRIYPLYVLFQYLPEQQHSPISL